MALGDEKTNFFNKLARLVKKHGRHGPMYFRNGQGLEMIGHNPIITKLGGFTAGLGICLPKHVELNL